MARRGRRRPLAADVAAPGPVVFGRVGHLAHGEVDQEAPQLGAVAGRAVRARGRGEEAGEHAVDDVVHAGAAEDPRVQPAAHHGAEPLGEAQPELPRRLLAPRRVGRVQVVRVAGQRSLGPHARCLVPRPERARTPGSGPRTESRECPSVPSVRIRLREPETGPRFSSGGRRRDEIGTVKASTCLKDSETAAGNPTETVSGRGPGIPSHQRRASSSRSCGSRPGLAPGEPVAARGALP